MKLGMLLGLVVAMGSSALGQYQVFYGNPFGPGLGGALYEAGRRSGSAVGPRRERHDDGLRHELWRQSNRIDDLVQELRQQRREQQEAAELWLRMESLRRNAEVDRMVEQSRRADAAARQAAELQRQQEEAHRKQARAEKREAAAAAARDRLLEQQHRSGVQPTEISRSERNPDNPRETFFYDAAGKRVGSISLSE